MCAGVLKIGKVGRKKIERSLCNMGVGWSRIVKVMGRLPSGAKETGVATVLERQCVSLGASGCLAMAQA